ncbi:MAG TPA: AMP-dependent synthetase/ligase, partial [Pirellulaceae bacterium]|nr:AMP-dependent synthetase/ligase [Pirellulaceae bacterium]
EFHAITWRELQISVDAVVGVLLKLGVQPGDRVAQLSENRFEWLLLDLACALMQAVHVPLHASLSAAQAIEQISHSGAKLVAVSTKEQATKLAHVMSHWPAGLTVIGYVDCGEIIGAAWRGQLTELCQQTTPGESWEVVNDFARNITPQTLATILYTSGTTGEPKGVMLTHGNLVSNATAQVTAFGEQPDEVKFNFLPLSHIFARTCDLYGWLVRGGELVLASSRETMMAEIALFRPTVINGVPYFYDRLYRTLRDMNLLQAPGVLRKMLGGNIRYCNSGGAALPKHLFDFYEAQGVALLEGYGLSESSPVISLSTVEHTKRGAVGRAIADVEIRIAEDGEILTRGPHVMPGYWRNPAATAEAMDNDWLRTGDLGSLDADGYLFITGRKKELLVLLSGKNIAPVYLESLLTADPLISQAMIIGDGRAFLTALIVPNWQAPEIAGLGAKANSPELVALIRKHIDACLAQVSYHEQVRRFTLLEHAFSLERGELTPKLSLRRGVVAEQYAPEIAAMYAAGETSGSS